MINVIITVFILIFKLGSKKYLNIILYGLKDDDTMLLLT